MHERTHARTDLPTWRAYRCPGRINYAFFFLFSFSCPTRYALPSLRH